MSVDDRTLNLSYAKPHTDNSLDVDVLRLRSALDEIDADVFAKLDASSYSASDVLTKIKTVDGTGCGLDADLLDGIHATGFSDSTHTHADATTAASGFFTAAEKTKLTAIEAGAQVNTVASVAGKTGAVTLTAADCSASPSTHTHALTEGRAYFYGIM